MRRLNAPILLGLILAIAAQLPAAATTPPPIDPPVRIAIIGDRTGGHQPGVYEGIVAEVARMHPDLILNVGDMIEGYSTDSLALETMWAQYDSIVAPLGPILHRTPGNHDITYNEAEPVYRHRNGPPNQSFDYRGIHVVTLDSSRWDVFEQIPAEQLAWLTDDLQRNTGAPCTIVVMHKPLWFRGVASGQPDPLHALFVRTGVDAVFTGHYHQYLSGDYDGIRYTSVGSSGGETGPQFLGPQYHYTWVTLDGERVDVAPIAAGSTLPWAEVPAKDYLALEARVIRCLRFPEPFRVPFDLGACDATVSLVVDNQGGSSAIEDTLRWSVPPDWTIDPATVALHVERDASQTLNFRVARTGRLYPVPSVTLHLPYKDGQTFPVEKSLAVARTADAVRGTPVIDARTDEALWRNPIDRFFAPDGEPMKTDKLQVYFAYDDKNVYVGAVCHDTHIDSLRATATERDGTVYNDDCMGFFIEPKLRSGTAYQIYVNPAGTVFDQKLERHGGSSVYEGDRSWNGEYEIRTQKSTFAWILEMRIPIAQFDTHLGKNQPWRLNFRRKQPRVGSAADWQVPIDYNPDTWGFLRFK